MSAGWLFIVERRVTVGLKCALSLPNMLLVFPRVSSACYCLGNHSM